jgi:hypothetical protein
MQVRNPPAGSRWGLGTGGRDEDEENLEREHDEVDMDRFLDRNGYAMTESDRARFLPMFVEARREVYKDLTRAARDKDFSESTAFVRSAPSPSKQIDFPAAFEFYCDKAGIKGGCHGRDRQEVASEDPGLLRFREAHGSRPRHHRRRLPPGRPPRRSRNRQEEHSRRLDRFAEGCACRKLNLAGN